MNEHAWVAMTFQPIDVELKDDGTLHTFTTEASEEIARDEAHLCCFHCLVDLTVESFDTLCPGPPV